MITVSEAGRAQGGSPMEAGWPQSRRRSERQTSGGSGRLVGDDTMTEGEESSYQAIFRPLIRGMIGVRFNQWRTTTRGVPEGPLDEAIIRARASHAWGGDRIGWVVADEREYEGKPAAMDRTSPLTVL